MRTCYVVHEKVHKLDSHKTAVDLYSRPHGPTAWQARDVMLIRIFQDGCAVHESINFKLESAKGSKVIVKNFFLKCLRFHFWSVMLAWHFQVRNMCADSFALACARVHVCLCAPG